MKTQRLFFLFVAVFCLSSNTKAQTKNKFENVREIVAAGQIDIANYPLFLVPTKGLYVAIGNSLLAIDSQNNEAEITLSDSIYIDDITSIGPDLIIKQGSSLLSFVSDCKPIVTFDTSSFTMFPSLDENLFIATQKNSTSDLMFFDIKEKKITPLSNFEEQVVYVLGDTIQCCVVTTTKIYMFKGNNGKKLLEYTEPIHTAIITDNGILFSTKNQILLLRDENKVNILADFGCRRLVSDSSSFFAEYDDGSIIWYYFPRRN